MENSGSMRMCVKFYEDSASSRIAQWVGERHVLFHIQVVTEDDHLCVVLIRDAPPPYHDTPSIPLTEA